MILRRAGTGICRKGEAMTIESVVIENFQSHVNTVLEPAPAGQLTVIVGPSDSGKTAIIRALRWNYYDIPRGTDFINVKANAARVTVSGVGSTQVVRERSRKGYNRYVVDGQKYEGFGGEIPAEVLEATGVRPVAIGDLKLNLNLAEQLDGPFLGKSVSTLARAKVLGKLAGTEEVDCAAKQLGTDLYRRKLDEKKLDDDIKNLEKQIGEYDYLPELAQRIAELKKVVAGARAARERGEKLADTKVKLTRVNAGKTEARAVIDRWKCVELAARSLAAAGKAADRGKALICHRKKILEVREGIVVSSGIVQRWSGLAEAQGEILKASEAGAWITRLMKLGDLYYAARHNVIDAMDAIDRWHGLETAENEYSTAVSAVVQRELLARRRELLKQIRTAIGESRKVADRLAGLDEAEVEAKRALIVGAAVASIKILSQELDWVRSAKSEAKAILCRTTRIEKAEELTQNLEAATSKQGKIISLAGRLHQAKTNARLLRESAVLWEHRVSVYEGAYRDELVMLGRCPMCGGDIDIQKLKEVV